MKYSGEAKRANLLKTCMEKKLSEDMTKLIGLTIKYTRLSQGEEAAEAQAEEITQVLTSGKPQEEIEDKLWEISRRRGIKTDDEPNGRAGDSN